MPEYGWNTTAGLSHLVQGWLAIRFIFHSTLSENSSLFNFFWSVEKHDATPANTGAIGLAKSVKSALMTSPLLDLLADSG